MIDLDRAFKEFNPRKHTLVFNRDDSEMKMRIKDYALKCPRGTQIRFRNNPLVPIGTIIIMDRVIFSAGTPI